MKFFKSIALLVMVSIFAVGCTPATVPPAHKGKILSASGYQPDILEPGKLWLTPREDLVLIETRTNTYKESVKVILQDKQTLAVEVRFRGRIKGNAKILNAMFNDITTGDDQVVQFTEVYGVYGRMAVRNKTREVIGQYNVDEVHKNYARLSSEISKSLVSELQNTPVEISDVAMGDIKYPDVVTKAIEATEERRLAITKEEAQAEIEATKKKNEQRLAELDYQTRMTKAKTIRDENKTIGEGITPQLLELKRLEVQQAMVEASGEKTTIFMPYESLNNSGAQNRIYR